MWDMLIDPNKLELRTYPQEASYRCRRWDWKVWRGSELMDEGTVEGSDSDARRAGQAALDKLRDAENDG
jgi:hypothetical protein